VGGARDPRGDDDLRVEGRRLAILEDLFAARVWQILIMPPVIRLRRDWYITCLVIIKQGGQHEKWSNEKKVSENVDDGSSGIVNDYGFFVRFGNGQTHRIDRQKFVCI
jgi:hypothetical protein